MESFLGDKVRLFSGDCREQLKLLPDNSVDSGVMDPPYALVSIGKRFGAEDAAPAKAGKTGAYKRASAGFMGKKWDTGETAFAAEFWTEVLRVLKPGAHLAAFSGTRTYHRMACAIEDAGFEIRDQLAWTYGSGFPKSHNQKGEWEGWGTALKPAWEPICLARKPITGTVAGNLADWGVGALNIDGCRVGNEGGARSNGGDERTESQPGAIGAYGTSPLVPGLGRWPANIIHDGSEEVLAAFPETHSAGAAGYSKTRGHYDASNMHVTGGSLFRIGDAGGSAARFFYTAKADGNDRLGSKHPTVKPLDLMQWLCRLITPPGGTVLDCFAGTGTTGEAAWREGFNAILMEREPEYLADIRKRMAIANQHSSARKIARAKPVVETQENDFFNIKDDE